MSTIYAHTDIDGDQIEVATVVAPGRLAVCVKDADEWSAAVYVTKEQAPTLALALLEAAGFTGNNDLLGAVACLRNFIEQQEAAKEREALDAEAQRLYSVGQTAAVEYAGYHQLNEDSKDWWRMVARKAREVHGKASA